MAETVHLTLKVKKGGTVIEGDSHQTSLGRENTIECLSFIDAVRTAREAASGKATGRRTYEPIKITKRIDRSSPILAQALCQNQALDGEFRFFRPSPDGDGTTEQFFTITIEDAQIHHIHRSSPNVIDPASANMPPVEEIALVFHTITWAYGKAGEVLHKDSWSENQ